MNFPPCPDLDRRRFLALAGAAAALPPAVGDEPDFADAVAQLFENGAYGGFYRLALAGPGPRVSADDAAQAAAFVGLERRAAELLSHRFSLRPSDEGVWARDPLAEIERRASDTRVVIISEWHHAPRHRWYLGRILERLRPLGYRLLAAETFSPLISQAGAGVPLQRLQGFYLNDPFLAGTVRDHLAGGGTLAAYDVGDESTAGAAREALQVRELERLIHSLGSEDKLVVYAGPGHGAEVRNAMAGRLAEAVGLNPLTLVQTLAEPRISQAPRELWSAGSSGAYDLTVQHQLEPPQPGRPSWMTGSVATRVVRRPPGRTAPLIARATARDAGPDSIPLDLAILEAGQELAVLRCAGSDCVVFDSV